MASSAYKLPDESELKQNIEELKQLKNKCTKQLNFLRAEATKSPAGLESIDRIENRFHNVNELIFDFEIAYKAKQVEMSKMDVIDFEMIEIEFNWGMDQSSALKRRVEGLLIDVEGDMLRLKRESKIKKEKNKTPKKHDIPVKLEQVEGSRNMLERLNVVPRHIQSVSEVSKKAIRKRKRAEGLDEESESTSADDEEASSPAAPRQEERLQEFVLVKAHVRRFPKKRAKQQNPAQ